MLVFVAGYKEGIFSNEFPINVSNSGILLTNLSSFLIPINEIFPFSFIN